MSRILFSFLAASLMLTAGCGASLAQSTLPLRGSMEEEQTAGAAAEPVTSTPLSETRLEIAPVENQPVRQQPQPPEADPYAPTGIGTGSLRLYPALTIGGAYTSNVKQSGSDPEPDAGLLLRPVLRVATDWSRHEYTANLDGDLIYYRDNSDFNSRTINADQRLRLDVRRFTTATLDMRYTLDTPEDDDPEEQTLSGGLALQHDFGPMVATLRGGLLGKDFGDTERAGGGSQDNGDLNYVEPSLSLRAAYRLSEMVRPYVEASYAPRVHRETPDRDGFNRDSEGYEFGAGVEIASGPIWTGELGLTYLHRNYKDGELEPASALGVTGEITWSPSELTAIVMSARTSIDEVASSTNPGKPVYSFRSDITHALRDNVDVTAGAGVEIEDLATSIDRTYDASLGLAWKFNPVLAWTAGYDVTWLDSETRGASYTEHRFSTGLTVSR